MIVRDRRPADDDAIDRLTRTAFAASPRGHNGEAELVRQLRADGDAAIELLAEEDAAVIGHVMLSPMRTPSGALGLGPISADPSRWREGIGSALMRAAIDRAATSGAKLIFLLGEPSFYGRFGFDTVVANQFDHDFPPAYFQALRLAEGGPEHGSCRYAAAFGDGG